MNTYYSRANCKRAAAVSHLMTFYPEPQIINLSGHFSENHPIPVTRLSP